MRAVLIIRENPIELFRAAMQSAGLRPCEITPDDRWYRCSTDSHPRGKNGAYKLSLDGTFGLFQDWAIHPNPMVWSDRSSKTISAGKRTSANQFQADERQELATAIKSARCYFDGCQRLRDGHPYSIRKQLEMTGCSGLRTDAAGWLVVPMQINGAFVSVQRISPDGKKLFWPGAPTRGATYIIERHGAELTVICEGLATGLAIFNAAPTSRVVVGFYAGNLVRVAETLPRRGMAVVAADNDLATETRTGVNPGIKAAQEAAAVLRCGIAVPRGIAGTDWLDFRNEKIKERRQQESDGRRDDSEIVKAVDAVISAAMALSAADQNGNDHAR
jgi:putative DNA primase/helicase